MLANRVGEVLGFHPRQRGVGEALQDGAQMPGGCGCGKCHAVYVVAIGVPEALVRTSKLKLHGEVLVEVLWKGDHRERSEPCGVHRVRFIWVFDVQEADSR